MVLSLAVALVLSAPSAPDAVAGSIVAQAQKVEVMRHKNKKPAPTTETSAQATKDNAAQEAALNQKQAQLDAKAKQLEQRETELKEKETAAEEKKERDAKRHAAQQKAADELSNQQTTDFQNAASALGGN